MSKRCPVVTFAVVLFFLVAAPVLRAQDVPKVEVGIQVTALNLGDFKLAVPNLGDSQRGVGGRRPDRRGFPSGSAWACGAGTVRQKAIATVAAGPRRIISRAARAA